MKKSFGFLSIMFWIIIPFGTIFYLMYSLLNNQSVNLLSGGIALTVLKNKFEINVDSHIIITYFSIYLILVLLTFVFYKSNIIRKKLKRS